jgi:hypothetical protein
MKCGGGRPPSHLLLCADRATIAFRLRRDQRFSAEATPISEQNVHVMRRGIDAWNRDGHGEWLAVFAPEAEWHTTGRFADRGVYRRT